MDTSLQNKKTTARNEKDLKLQNDLLNQYIQSLKSKLSDLTLSQSETSSRLEEVRRKLKSSNAVKIKIQNEIRDHEEALNTLRQDLKIEEDNQNKYSETKKKEEEFESTVRNDKKLIKTEVEEATKAIINNQITQEQLWTEKLIHHLQNKSFSITEEKRKKICQHACEDSLPLEEIISVINNRQSAGTEANYQENQVMKMPSYSVPLSLEGIYSLAPGRWMNGETIEYYIESVLKQTKSNVFLVKPTWFADGEKKRLEQTKKIMLNEYAIAPLNTENKTHWAILWISLKNNKMQWFDSQPIYKLKKHPQLWMDDIEKELNKVRNMIFRKEIVENLPKQSDDVNCGAYSVFNATNLLNDVKDINYTKEDIEKFRRDEFYRHVNNGKELQEGEDYCVKTYRQAINRKIQSMKRNFTDDTKGEITCLDPAIKKSRN